MPRYPPADIGRTMASAFTTSGVLPSAVERAVINKGRLSTTSLFAPLVLLHAASSSSSFSVHKVQAFARHAHFIYHHLLGKFQDSARYRGLALVGLEDLPCIRHQNGEQEGVLAALDGVALAQYDVDENSMRVAPLLDMSSAEAFVDSIRRALPAPPSSSSSSSPSTPSRSGSRKEGEDEAEGEEEEEEADEDDPQDIALGIDSLNMLAHNLRSMPATILALRNLLSRSSRSSRSSSSSSRSSSSVSLSPVLSVLHSEGGNPNQDGFLSHAWRLALEDLATTNVYLYPDDEVSGRCLVVRKSASGKVIEEWENYAIDSNDGSVRFHSPSKQNASTTTCSTTKIKPETTVAPSNNNSGSRQKEAAFLESLPFRLSLTEQERAMRGQTILPHERQRHEDGRSSHQQQQQQLQQPLIYNDVEGGDEDDDEDEEYDDDIDDDLDL